ncbi:metallo-beta-lactamase domain-containing protein 1-like isoform X1 [Mizuhopecten yessoensis]|uniref:metallo-beta-lactamase domain-containing protein 1-like isoform X1 n=1 Tax=Mizuhopecten yessoensis TaxID=6573 RepID=UPI000B4599E9|nr:metallo-beta-lactamase domain-containing protein 1-like isoform X1 [Mizuhopecten yessoensis]
MYEVIILKEGYSRSEGPGHQIACGTITLLKGPKHIIVDTGNPWDKDLILKGLEKHGTCPDKIEYVVCSHGHSDHVGNLNLFVHATHILSHDVCHGDDYTNHDFDLGIPYEIDDDVEVVPTAGHTGSDVSVIVRNTKLGTVAITGDLFECQEDLENPSLWQDNSEKPDIQEQNRINILKIADFIVPGHGKMFKVPEDYKRQMRVVMYYEEVQATIAGGKSESTKLEYVVMEDD